MRVVDDLNALQVGNSLQNTELHTSEILGPFPETSTMNMLQKPFFSFNKVGNSGSKPPTPVIGRHQLYDHPIYQYWQYGPFDSKPESKWDGPDDHSIDLGVSWDRSNLFIYVKVTDDNYLGIAQGQPWEGDGWQIGVSHVDKPMTLINGGRFNLTLSEEDLSSYTFFYENNIGSSSKMGQHIHRDEDNKLTHIKIRIPYEMIGSIPFDEGMAIRLAVGVWDGDLNFFGPRGQGWSGWGTDALLHCWRGGGKCPFNQKTLHLIRPEGTLTLSDLPPLPPNSPPPPSPPPPMPHMPDITYSKGDGCESKYLWDGLPFRLTDAKLSELVESRELTLDEVESLKFKAVMKYMGEVDCQAGSPYATDISYSSSAKKFDWWFGSAPIITDVTQDDKEFGIVVVRAPGPFKSYNTTMPTLMTAFPSSLKSIPGGPKPEGVTRGWTWGSPNDDLGLTPESWKDLETVKKHVCGLPGLKMYNDEGLAISQIYDGEIPCPSQLAEDINAVETNSARFSIRSM